MSNPFIFLATPSNNIIKEAMHYRKARSELINSNIANIDTPYYKSRDIRFESYLSEKTSELFNDKKDKTLEMAKTSPKHMDPQPTFPDGQSYVFYRDGHSVRNDGNSVDLDTETIELAKNAEAYKALSAFAKKQSTMFKYAIESSSKLA